jgi:hypothetical protein
MLIQFQEESEKFLDRSVVALLAAPFILIAGRGMVSTVLLRFKSFLKCNPQRQRTKFDHMISHGASKNSYFEQYKRVRGVNTEDLDKQNLLTDRSVYLTFLENQLERVSSSCMTVVSFKDRMLDIETQTVDMDSRLTNGLRRLKMHIPNEEELAEKSDKLQLLHDTMSIMSQRIESLEQDKERESIRVLQLEERLENYEKVATAASAASVTSAVPAASVIPIAEKDRSGGEYTPLSDFLKWTSSVRQDFKEVRDSMPSETAMVESLSRVLSTTLRDVIASSVDPKLSDIIRFVEEANQTVHDRLLAQISKNTEHHASEIAQISQHAQQHKEHRDRLTNQLEAMQLLIASRERQLEAETSKLASSSPKKKKKGKKSNEHDNNISTSELTRINTRITQLEHSAHQEQMNQNSLLKITANAVDSVGQRVHKVEVVSNASNHAMEKILDLIQVSRDDRSKVKEKVEILSSKVQHVEVRMVKYESVQKAHKDVENSARRAEVEREKEAREFVLKKIMETEQEQKRQIERSEQQEKERELREMLTNERQVREKMVIETEQKERLWREQMAAKEQEVIAAATAASTTATSAAKMTKLTKTTKTTKMTPNQAKHKKHYNPAAAAGGGRTSVQQTKEVSREVLNNEVKRMQRDVDRKITVEVSRHAVKTQEQLKSEMFNIVKKYVDDNQQRMKRQVEVQVDKAVAKRMEKTVEMVTNELSSSVDTSVAATQAKLQHNFVRDTREAMRLEMEKIKKDVQKHLHSSVNKIEKTKEAVANSVENMLEQMVVRTVNDVVVEQKRRSPTAGMRLRTPTMATAVNTESPAAVQFRNDLQALRKDLNMVTMAVNGTAEHLFSMSHIVDNQETAGRNSKTATSDRRRRDHEYDDDDDDDDDDDEEDTLGEVMDELRAWTTLGEDDDDDDDKMRLMMAATVIGEEDVQTMRRKENAVAKRKGKKIVKKKILKKKIVVKRGGKIARKKKVRGARKKKMENALPGRSFDSPYL